MKNSYINLYSEDIENLLKCLQAEIGFEVTKQTNNNIVLIKEQFYSLNSSFQLNIIVLNLINGIIQIDIVSCGGEFVILWKDSEVKFVEIAEQIISDFCIINNISSEKITNL